MTLVPARTYHVLLCPTLSLISTPLRLKSQGTGSEGLLDVATLFNLRFEDVQRDNQGTIADPREPLAGRSILLCGRDGACPGGSGFHLSCVLHAQFGMTLKASSI
jgi:hypothetical protein